MQSTLIMIWNTPCKIIPTVMSSRYKICSDKDAKIMNTHKIKKSKIENSNPMIKLNKSVYSNK